MTLNKWDPSIECSGQVVGAFTTGAEGPGFRTQRACAQNYVSLIMQPHWKKLAARILNLQYNMIPLWWIQSRVWTTQQLSSKSIAHTRVTDRSRPVASAEFSNRTAKAATMKLYHFVPAAQVPFSQNPTLSLLSMLGDFLLQYFISWFYRPANTTVFEFFYYVNSILSSQIPSVLVQ